MVVDHLGTVGAGLGEPLIHGLLEERLVDVRQHLGEPLPELLEGDITSERPDLHGQLVAVATQPVVPPDRAQEELDVRRIHVIEGQVAGLTLVHDHVVLLDLVDVVGQILEAPRSAVAVLAVAGGRHLDVVPPSTVVVGVTPGVHPVRPQRVDDGDGIAGRDVDGELHAGAPAELFEGRAAVKGDPDLITLLLDPQQLLARIEVTKVHGGTELTRIVSKLAKGLVGTHQRLFDGPRSDGQLDLLATELQLALPVGASSTGGVEKSGGDLGRDRGVGRRFLHESHVEVGLDLHPHMGRSVVVAGGKVLE